jgi:hypothetical protein
MIWPAIREIRAIRGKKPGFYAFVKNTYLTRQPPTRIYVSVCKGFVFKKKVSSWPVQIPPVVITSSNEHALSRQLEASECPGIATVLSRRSNAEADPVTVPGVSRRISR